jgi:hypothetical protein
MPIPDNQIRWIRHESEFKQMWLGDLTYDIKKRPFIGTTKYGTNINDIVSRLSRGEYQQVSSDVEDFTQLINILKNYIEQYIKMNNTLNDNMYGIYINDIIRRLSEGEYYQVKSELDKYKKSLKVLNYYINRYIRVMYTLNPETQEVNIRGGNRKPRKRTRRLRRKTHTKKRRTYRK